MDLSLIVSSVFICIYLYFFIFSIAYSICKFCCSFTCFEYLVSHCADNQIYMSMLCCHILALSLIQHSALYTYPFFAK